MNGKTSSKFAAQFFSAKNLHFAALLSATVLHGGLLFWAIAPSDKIIVTQQTIQVSFVAPNSQKKQSEKSFHEKALPLSEQKNALKQQKKSENSAAKKQAAQNQIDKKTSGRVDPNSVSTKAAESDPVFDAAYLNNPAPYYPQSAKRKGMQGMVFLNVVVKPDGTPLTVTIARSSGSPELDEAALDAVRDWKFVPARRAGQLVQANVIVPIEFKII